MSSLASKLQRLENTAASITTCSRYMVLMLSSDSGTSICASYAAALEAALLAAAAPERSATLVNLISDVLHATQRDARVHPQVCAALVPVLRRAFALAAAAAGASEAPVARLRKLVAHWRERGVLGAEALGSLGAALDAPHAALQREGDGAALLELAARRAGEAAGSTSSSSGSGSAGLLVSPSIALDALQAALARAGAQLGQSAANFPESSARLKEQEAARAVQDALAGVEQADITVRMCAEDVVGLRALAGRAFVVETRVREEVARAGSEAASASCSSSSNSSSGRKRGRLEEDASALEEECRQAVLADSLPFGDLIKCLENAKRHTAALREERRLRRAALGALSVWCQQEKEVSESARVAQREAQALAFLEGVQAVRAKVLLAHAEEVAAEAAEGQRVAAAEAAAAAAAAAAAVAGSKPAEPAGPAAALTTLAPPPPAPSTLYSSAASALLASTLHRAQVAPMAPLQHQQAPFASTATLGAAQGMPGGAAGMTQYYAQQAPPPQQQPQPQQQQQFFPYPLQQAAQPLPPAYQPYSASSGGAGGAGGASMFAGGSVASFLSRAVGAGATAPAATASGGPGAPLVARGSLASTMPAWMQK